MWDHRLGCCTRGEHQKQVPRPPLLPETRARPGIHETNLLSHRRVSYGKQFSWRTCATSTAPFIPPSFPTRAPPRAAVLWRTRRLVMLGPSASPGTCSNSLECVVSSRVGNPSRQFRGSENAPHAPARYLDLPLPPPPPAPLPPRSLASSSSCCALRSFARASAGVSGFFAAVEPPAPAAAADPLLRPPPECG